MNFKIFILSEARGSFTVARYLGNCPGHGVQSIINLSFLNEILGRICILIAYRVLALTDVLGPCNLVTFRYRGKRSMYFPINAIVCHIYNLI